ncbi:hypothetical protein D6833_13795, partial [Candidatus Parcubacteria bacterium]
MCSDTMSGMQIRTVEHRIPEHCLDNDTVVRELTSRNACRFGPAWLENLNGRVAHFLERAGTHVRYRMGDGKRAIELMTETVHSALDRAGLQPDDVDFLIYTGVARGWVEPA